MGVIVELHRHVALMGMMASGKSTLGVALAAALGVQYVDNDATIERALEATGRQVARRDGVAALHALEEQMLLRQLEADVPSVVAAAASTIESAACREALARRATVVWLVISVDEALRRIDRGTHRRPIDAAELSRLETVRTPWFEEIADLEVDATDPTEQQVARVIEFLRIDR